MRQGGQGRARRGMARLGNAGHGKASKIKQEVCKMVYKYEWNYRHYPVEADCAGREFERIEKEKGEVTAENLLDSSREENAPMHPCFEWNDSVAAEKFRLGEAREIIGSLVRVFVEIETEQPKQQRAYVNVNPDVGFGAKGSYVSIVKALSEEETRRIVLKRALNEFISLKKKYEVLTELGKIFASIDKAGKLLQEGEVN